MPFLSISDQIRFCNKKLLITYVLHGDVKPYYSAAQRRVGIANIPLLQERLQNNKMGSWNNHSAISCSPMCLHTRVIWRIVRGRHHWRFAARFTACKIICLFRRCVLSSLWFRRILISHDCFNPLTSVINTAAQNWKLTLYCEQYIMKSFFLLKKT